VHIGLASSLLAPFRFLTLFLASIPTFYSPYHHDSLILKNCSTNFLALSYTYASLDNDMDHSHVSYKSRTMVLLLERDLATLLPSTTQRLEIHSYNFLMSCITYTKQLLSSLSPYSGSIEMLDSSYPLSTPLLLDLSIDTSFLPTTGLLVGPLSEFENFIVLKGTSTVVIVISQTGIILRMEIYIKM
jgi:hypothetical protein